MKPVTIPGIGWETLKVLKNIERLIAQQNQLLMQLIQEVHQQRTNTR